MITISSYILLWPITIGANRVVNQSESLAVICKTSILRELKKSCIQDVIGFGFGFASHWLKNWCKFLSQSLCA